MHQVRGFVSALVADHAEERHGCLLAFLCTAAGRALLRRGSRRACRLTRRRATVGGPSGFLHGGLVFGGGWRAGARPAGGGGPRRGRGWGGGPGGGPPSPPPR